MSKKFNFKGFKLGKQNSDKASKSKKKKVTKNDVRVFLGKALRYVSLMILTVFILSVAYIALPKTETIIPDYRFDFTQEELQENRYILELQVKAQDEDQLDKKVEETKAIIQKRLYKAGADEVAITGYHFDNPTPDTDYYLYRYIQVYVKSNLTDSELNELIGVRNYLRLYLPKDDVDFENEENPYAEYFIENYNPTNVTLHDFRNVLIKRLPDSSGTETYFAIFKPKTFGDFKAFAEEHGGENIGFAVDESIYQLELPSTFKPDYTSTSSSSTKAEFTIGITQDARVAEITDIMFNSGVITLEYNVYESEALGAVTSPIKSTLFSFTLIVAMLLFGLYNYFIAKESFQTVFRNLFEIAFALAAVFSFLKFWYVPVNTTVLLFESLAVLLISHDFLHKSEGRLTRNLFIFVGAFLIYIFGFGYISLIGRDIAIMLIALSISEQISEYYITNMKSYLLND